jgi:hypothetical protein
LRIFKERRFPWRLKAGGGKVIVEIDNALWQMAPELREAVKKVNPEMPTPAEWDPEDR